VFVCPVIFLALLALGDIGGSLQRRGDEFGAELPIMIRPMQAAENHGRSSTFAAQQTGIAPQYEVPAHHKSSRLSLTRLPFCDTIQ